MDQNSLSLPKLTHSHPTQRKSYTMQCASLETLDQESSKLWSCKKPEEKGALILGSFEAWVSSGEFIVQ